MEWWKWDFCFGRERVLKSSRDFMTGDNSLSPTKGRAPLLRRLVPLLARQTNILALWYRGTTQRHSPTCHDNDNGRNDLIAEFSLTFNILTHSATSSKIPELIHLMWISALQWRIVLPTPHFPNRRGSGGYKIIAGYLTTLRHNDFWPS
jgi:hypothetical protein